MKLTDYMRLGWEQLKRRVVVTALCTMGIAIGSASIVVALAFGESINHYSRMQMSFYLKSDEITVRSDQGRTESDSGDPNAAKPYELTKAKIDLIRKFPHVKALATYQTLDSFKLQVDNKEGYINQIYATELETLPDFGSEMQQGGPSDQDNTIILSYGATMGLIDQQMKQSRQLQARGGPNERQAADVRWEQMYIAYPMYQKQILLSAEIFRQNSGPETGDSFPLRVVGILKKPEGVPDDIVMSQKTAFVSPALGKRLQDSILLTSGRNSAEPSGAGGQDTGEYNEVKIKVDDSSHVKELEPMLKKLKLSVETNLHREEQMQTELVMIRLIFGGVGIFILFVASISIIVAMTMSTYQRRRQIGIMKVLGANLKQIRNMFMVESALLGLLGGMAGILLSYWVIWGINIAVMKFSPPRGQQEVLFISFWILPVGLFFAVMTGVLSGIYPAVKASRTDALTAIKRD